MTADGLADTAHYLAKAGLIGIVHLDTNLIATAAYGFCADAIALARPIGESLLPLLGLDAEIRALRDSPMSAVELPNISIQSAEEEQPRLNLAVYWRPDRAHYAVILSRIAATPTFELELQAQINARLLAEEQLLQKSAELESFAYVISHDLRAPLRALRHSSDEVRLALDDAPPDIDRAGSAAHELIVQSRRMSAMLLGLLEYAQIGRRPEALETVDSAALMRDIAGGLGKTKLRELRLEGDWPIVETFRAPLDLVLRNLVDNALKHHDRNQAIITAVASDAGRHWLFAITDDGPGIPPEWQRAIFEPFRKVNGDENSSGTTEGSGIGLALVKKTVETLKGRIDVRSDPATARGTTFRVFWPKRTPATWV
jgi:signal transduction histidine kinase